MKDDVPDINRYNSIEFSVIVEDCFNIQGQNCPPLRSEPITIVILINDVNDFAPEIFSKEKTPKISENSAPDEPVFDVYVTDRDSDPINQIAKIEVVSQGSKSDR